MSGKPFLCLGSGLFYGYPLKYVVEKTGAMGFSHLEITGPLHTNAILYDYGKIPAVKRQLARAGVTVSSIHTYISEGDPRSLDRPDYYRRLAGLATRLGAGVIVDHVAYFGACSRREKTAKLKDLAALFAGEGVRYSFENLVESPEEIAYFLDRVPDLFFTFDVAHALWQGHSLSRFVSLTSRRLANLHLLGYHPVLSPVCGDGLAPGADSFSWKELAGSLRTAGYAGQLTIELFPENFVPAFLLLSHVCEQTKGRRMEVEIPRLTYPEIMKRLPAHLLKNNRRLGRLRLVYDRRGQKPGTTLGELLGGYTRKFCARNLLKELRP